jgi:Skp family chaperone for outer membrane proteins
MKSAVPALLALLIVPLTSPVASAQASTPADPPLGGAPVPGVCLLSRPAVFANARVGIAATQRLKQLVEQVQAEIDGERKPVEADRKAFQAEQATLSPEQRQSRAQALDQRLQAVRQKTALRGREIEVTREKALARIVSAMQPLVQEAYHARTCGLLVDRGSVLGGNMTNDLTPAVIRGLDARMTAITFDRESLARSVPADPQ